MALSELRIIITVVVGAMRRHSPPPPEGVRRRMCAMTDHGGEKDGDGDDNDEERVRGERMEKGVYLPTAAGTHTAARDGITRTDLDGNLRHSEALAKKIG